MFIHGIMYFKRRKLLSMPYDNNVTEEQYKNAYISGMGFLMKHFLKVTSSPNKFETLDNLIQTGNNYFIESNNTDTLMQVASFVIHKNIYYIGESDYPNFKGFSFRHYKKLMDDMMSGSYEYENAKENEILMLYFPRDIYSFEKIVQCLSPIVSSRDGDRYINLILTTNPNLKGHFKLSDMTSDRKLIYKTLNLAQDKSVKVSSVNKKTQSAGEQF